MGVIYYGHVMLWFNRVRRCGGCAPCSCCVSNAGVGGYVWSGGCTVVVIFVVVVLVVVVVVVFFF